MNKNQVNQVPFPHDQTQSQSHKDPDGCLQGACHPLGNLKKVAFSFPHSELCHKRNNLPSHLEQQLKLVNAL